MSGSPVAVEEMLANMNHGGRVALLGLPKDRYAIDWGRVITHMITLRGIYGREMFETWYLMGSMLATSPSLRAAVSSVVTGRYPAESGGGVRRDPLGAGRQGRARLELRALAACTRPPRGVRRVKDELAGHADRDRGGRALQARARADHPAVVPRGRPAGSR